MIEIKDKILKFRLADQFWPKTKKAAKSTKGGRARTLVQLQLPIVLKKLQEFVRTLLYLAMVCGYDVMK